MKKRQLGKCVFAMVPVRLIDENDYNPNRMDEEAFEELVEEVRHLGRVPKPVVVRAVEGESETRYVIVDGAHSFRAACAVGLDEVQCEVIKVNDLEARIQTLKRNQSGTHDRLREGLLFAGMLELDKNVSQRKLAKRLGFSEGKLRCSLKYVDVLDVRMKCATKRNTGVLSAERIDEIHDEVGDMTQEEVRLFLSMPELMAESWVLALKPAIIRQKLPSNYSGFQFTAILERLEKLGLTDLIPGDTIGFVETLTCLLRYDGWMQERTAVQDLQEYLPACVEHTLETEFLDLLPIQFRSGTGTVVISPSAWGEIVSTTCERYADPTDRYSVMSQRVRSAVEQSGIDPGELISKKDASYLHVLDAACDQIRSADFLSLPEQVALHQVVGSNPHGDEATALEDTLSVFERRRSDAEVESAASEDANEVDVVGCYRKTLEALQQREAVAEEDAAYADTERLHESVRDWIQNLDCVQGKSVLGTPAGDVLAARLCAIPKPELVFFLAALGGDAVIPAEERWLAAVEADAEFTAA